MARRMTVEFEQPDDRDDGSFDLDEGEGEGGEGSEAPTLGDLKAAADAEAAEVADGLICRKCGCGHFRTSNTRAVRGGIKRYKQCRHCGRRTTTFERMGPPDP